MSLVQYCIDQVIDGCNDISDYVLTLAFDNPISGFGYPQYKVMGTNSDYSVAQGIRQHVIYRMIGRMINASGGTTELIDLSTARVKYMGGGMMSINVPDTLTGGRDILTMVKVYPNTVSSAMVYAGSNSGPTGQCNSGGAIGGSINSMVNNLTNDKVPTTFTEIQKAGRNSFIVRCTGMLLFSLSAKVIMSYDDEFSVIPPRAYEHFGKLTVLGTKAYIYKHCRRGLKEAVQRFGYPLDDIQDEIDGYADAYKEYEELYKKIKKILRYADSKGVSDHINMIVPRRLR